MYMTKKEAMDCLQKVVDERVAPILRSHPDKFMRMFNDLDLVSRLEKRFSRYKEDLLNHPENHQKAELDGEYILCDNYPRIMTMRVFLGTLLVDILWQQHLETPTIAQKRRLSSDAEALRKIAGHLEGMENLYMCDFDAGVLSELAHGLEKRSLQILPLEVADALNLKKSYKAFAIKIVHADVCNELPCIQTSHSIHEYNQSSPNIEVARIVHHLLCESVSPNDVAQVMDKERREYYRD